MTNVVRHGPNPDFENLLAARNILRREKALAAAGKVFDVGVVAVVEAAGFADDLKKMSARGAMFTQPGRGDLEGIPVFGAAKDIDRKAEADRGRSRVFLDHRDLETIE